MWQHGIPVSLILVVVKNCFSIYVPEFRLFNETATLIEQGLCIMA